MSLVMAGSGNPQPPQPAAKAAPSLVARPLSSGRTPAPAPVRKPPQVLHISKKDEQLRLEQEANEARLAAEAALQRAAELEAAARAGRGEAPLPPQRPVAPASDSPAPAPLSDAERFDMGGFEGLTMADLLGPESSRQRRSGGGSSGSARMVGNAGASAERGQERPTTPARTVDDFDFDEEAFLAALDENEPIGTTGEVVSGVVLSVESDGVYVDVGGKAPGFMPKAEAALGVITNLKERFPKGMAVQVGKTLGVACLEVNPETRKLVLSEKKAATAALFTNLEVGQLVEGQVVAVKPYGLFVDLGGVSGLLHHSAITGGTMRDLREIFDQGDRLKALITELDPGRGRIALNTALLEGQPGELLIAKDTVMAEATDRANRARNMLRHQEQAAG